MHKDLILDPGSSKIRIRREHTDEVHSVPAFIAVNLVDNSTVAIGKNAARLLGRAPANIRVCRPICGGVVADYDMAVRLIQQLFDREYPRRTRPTVLLSLPIGITEEQRIALLDVMLDAGAKCADPVFSPLAAAYGTDIADTADENGRLLVDIGADMTQCVILSRGAIVAGKRIPIGSNTLDEALIRYLKEYSSFSVSNCMANQIKHQIGSAILVENDLGIAVCGRDTVSGLAVNKEITAKDTFTAYRPSLQYIISKIRSVLDETPPSFVSHIVENGLTLCGGGAKLSGIARLLADELSMRVTVAPNEDHAVIDGLDRIREQNLKLLIPISYKKSKSKIPKT